MRTAPAPLEPKAPTPSRGTFRAFRSRNFTTLWVGNLLSNTGTWMQQVAEPWLVLKLSNSPFLLGLDSFMTDAPIWALILAGGLLADRRDRRQTALFFQGIQVLCPILIVALLATHHLQVWMVIALSLVVGVTDALSSPSINALVPASVPEADVPSAVALNSAQFNLSRVLGPFFAGVAMATLGPIACFALNASSYVPYLLAIYLFRLPTVLAPSGPGSPAEPTARSSLLEALAVVAKRPRMRQSLMTVLVTSVLCLPLVTFIPVLIRDAFHEGSAQFGGALSVFGLGGLAGAALVLPLKSNRQRQILSSLAALGLSGLVMAAAWSEVFWTELVALFLIGAAMVASNTSANTILQSSIDGGLRGRISSLYTLALRGGAPLGNLATGMVVTHWGVRTALFANGGLALLCHLGVAQFGRVGRRASRASPAPAGP